MSFLAVLVALIAAIAEGISITTFILSRARTKRRAYSMLGIIFASIVILAFILSNIPSLRGSSAYTVYPTATPPSNPTQGITAVPTPISTPSPTPTLIPTPTPTPTPCPRPCVAYQENGSDNWQGWGLSSPWKVIPSKGLLINPGTAGSDSPSAIAPYNLNGVQNFAIEATIHITGDHLGEVGLTACITTQGGWQGYRGEVRYDNFYLVWGARIYRTDDVLSNIDFNPGTNWHTYRLEIRGNTITLLIDNAVITQATDNTYLQCGNQVGLWDSITTVEVSNFKIILL